MLVEIIPVPDSPEGGLGCLVALGMLILIPAAIIHACSEKKSGAGSANTTAATNGKLAPQSAQNLSGTRERSLLQGKDLTFRVDGLPTVIWSNGQVEVWGDQYSHRLLKPQERVTFQNIDLIMATPRSQNATILYSQNVQQQQVASVLEGERFPLTRTRILNAEDIRDWDFAKLRYAINEIYARHGSNFGKSKELRDYFSRYSWYSPVRSNSEAESLFTPIEKRNVDILASYRNARK